VLFLLGFVMPYILSVQHGSITFPRNRGGIYKLAADVSWFSFFAFLLLFLISNWNVVTVTLYRFAFFLFLTLQFLPLIRYRLLTRKRNYDTVSVLFFTSAFVWGIVSLLPLSYRPFLHSTFLGFQLAIFLGCMYFMLPRFSRKVKRDISLSVGLLVILLHGGAVLLNILGFYHDWWLLRWAAILLTSSLLIFTLQMWRFFFNYPIPGGIIIFLIALWFAWQYDRAHHVPLMLLGMGSFAFGMGKRWYMLNFGRGNSEYDVLYHLAYVFLLLSFFSRWFFALSGITLILWVFLNVREIKTLKEEMRLSILNWWKAF